MAGAVTSRNGNTVGSFGKRAQENRVGDRSRRTAKLRLSQRFVLVSSSKAAVRLPVESFIYFKIIFNVFDAIRGEGQGRPWRVPTCRRVTNARTRTIRTRKRNNNTTYTMAPAEILNGIGEI